MNSILRAFDHSAWRELPVAIKIELYHDGHSVIEGRDSESESDSSEGYDYDDDSD